MAKLNDKIDEAIAAARETIVPLLIRRRCTPHQQVVWTAIAFLLGAHPRADFGLREIAQEAGLTSVPRVKGWIDDLVALELLARETAEQPQERNNFPLIRSTYRIPWKYILEESLKLADSYVQHQVRGGNRLLSAMPSIRAEQQSLFEVRVSEGSHEGVSEGSHERIRSDTPSCDPSDTDGWMHGKDLRMDGESRARRKRSGPGRPPTIPSPPPADVYAQHPQWAIGGPLAAHPRELWRQACPAPTEQHTTVLNGLAAEHDEPTGGHGWYWVGRAILAGLHAEREPLGHPNYIRNTLIRWRAEDSYGSDKARPAARETPTYEQRPRPMGSRPRRAAAQAAQPAPHLSAGSSDDLSDEELQRIEDEAGAEFRRRIAERNA